MFAYVELNENRTRREKRKTPFLIGQYAVCNRRPIYRIRTDPETVRRREREFSCVLRRFGGRVLFPGGMEPELCANRALSGFEAYRREVFSLSADLLLRTARLNKRTRIVLLDCAGNYLTLAQKLAELTDRAMIVTAARSAPAYLLKSREIYRDTGAAIPVLIDRIPEKCDILLAGDRGGSLPAASLVFSVDAQVGGALSPARAFPDGIKTPEKIDAMAFSYALHAFCGAPTEPAYAFLCEGKELNRAEAVKLITI